MQVLKKNKKTALEKCSITSVTLMGVSPPPLWLPKNAITPEQVLRHHHSQCRGGMGGPALSSPSSYQCFVVHSIVQGILPSPKINVSRVCSGGGRHANRHTKQGNDSENKNGTNKAQHAGEGMK
jgi:hypothetical protein